MRSILITIAMILGFCLAGARGEGDAGRRIFSCFVWEDLGIGQVYYADGAVPKALECRAKRRSDTYEMPMGGAFKLYTGMEEDGKMTYQLVGEAAIKSASKRLLFIIEKKSKPDGLPLRISVMDDSIKSFPAGSTKFINLTARPINAEINGASAMIGSRQSGILQPEIPNGGAFIPLFLRYGETILYQTRIYCQVGERRIVFLTADPKGDSKRPVAVSFLPQIVGPSFAED